MEKLCINKVILSYVVGSETGFKIFVSIPVRINLQQGIWESSAGLSFFLGAWWKTGSILSYCCSIRSTSTSPVAVVVSYHKLQQQNLSRQLF